MPKVSVVIPIYNVEEYIRQALDSVVNQTLKDIEIICVNDSTPDNSFEIVKEYAQKDSRFVLIEQEENQGQGVARNKGISVSTGDYIMFLDPDDWFEVNACELAYNQISKNKNDIVFFNLNICKEKKGKITKIKKFAKSFKYFEKIMNNQHINLKEVEGNFISSVWCWCQIYDKNFLQKNSIEYSQHRFAEDLAFFVKAIINSEDVSILNASLYNYRRKSDKMTFDYTNVYKDVIDTKELSYRIINESPQKDIFLEKFLHYRVKSDLHWLKQFSKKNRNIAEDFYQQVKLHFNKLISDFGYSLIFYNNYEFNLILKSKTYKEFESKKFFVKCLKFLKG